MENMRSLFVNPPAAYRGKPFWSWNGKLEKDEILRQVDVLHEMGMGGYFCHSRTGLITEYLGDEWFSLINACAEKGRALGMETWLYDEDRWPSGIAGGMVTAHPEYRMHYLRLQIMESSGFTYTDDTVAAFNADVDGFAFRNKRRILPGEQGDGRAILRFSVEEMAPATFYNGYTYVDTMNPEATNEFIRVTHERYAEKCGSYIGNEIKGIFTDEPHRGAVMCTFGLNNADAAYLTPCPKDLFQIYQERYGEDLLENLPELYLWPNGEKIHPVKWRYMELLQELFLQNFMKPIQDWCHKHNMLFTGHVLHEDALCCQASMQGSVMRAYEFMDCPGVDILTEGNRYYCVVKQLQSAGRQLGKEWLLSELYGCTGWQFDFENHKAVGDWQALMGINLRCQHLSWYTMKGEAKRDYPASILHQSAWYPQYSYVEDYFSRLNVFLMQGKPKCDLLVINPVESMWSLIYPGWSVIFSMDDPHVAALEKRYEELYRLLLGARVDFDYGDEDYLARLACVEQRDGETILKVGVCYYKTVLVSGMLTMRSTTWKLLKDFQEAGGRLIFAGDPPCYMDAVSSDIPAKLAEAAQSVPFEKEEILSAVRTDILLDIKCETDMEAESIFAQIRQDGEDLLVALMNTDRKKARQGAKICIARGGYCEKWSPRTGEVSLLSEGDSTISFTYDFAPLEELLLRVTAQSSAQPTDRPERIDRYSMPDSFTYRLTEPNVCVLDFVDYRIDKGAWKERLEILKADRAIRSTVGLPLRGGEMLQPWFAGKQDQPVVCRLDLRFAFDVEIVPGCLELALETPEEFDISINGHSLTEVNEAYWVDTCFKRMTIDTAWLKSGRNEIVLSCGFRNDVDLEAVYLLGDFGVRLDGQDATLISLPEKLTVGNVVDQGLPFYGAGIRYQVPVPVCGDNQCLEVVTEDFEAACVRVIDGAQEEMLAFPPYHTYIHTSGDQLELEYTLTRRNTFGPLHLRGLRTAGYGPDTYIVEGEMFLNKEYGLLPEGMTAPVQIYLCRK